MIGEIRDKETAEAAVQASLTGHLVFSTLHTNDAAGATTRLLDMGVEPFLVASSVEGIMAQRLVRRICPDCKSTYEPEPSEIPPDFASNAAPSTHHATLLSRGSGCRECRGTGYRGRIGIYELLSMTEETREMVLARTNAGRIAQTAIEAGDLTLLRHAGFEKVRSGETTITEVLRATKA
jgi:type II secretory ATPase GspE/PulE/Tfp pilus assembly ATPase PilB-like protein